MSYGGSSDIQTSTANLELVITPVEWVGVKMAYTQFSFLNETDCHMKINGSEPIFLRAYQGFNMEVNKYTRLEPIS